jgi:hypothetical protein
MVDLDLKEEEGRVHRTSSSIDLKSFLPKNFPKTQITLKMLSVAFTMLVKIGLLNKKTLEQKESMLGLKWSALFTF